MSWKVYSGKRFTRPMSLTDLCTFRQEIIDLVKPIRLGLLNQFFANFITSQIDLNPTIMEDFASGDLSDMYHYLYFKFIANIKDSTTNTNCDEIDFNFSMSVYPSDDEVLFIPYSQQSKFLQVLDEHPYCEEYAYYDNVDEPEDVSVEDWELRGGKWKKALTHGISSSNDGLRMEFITRANVLDDFFGTQAFELMPSLEQRAKMIAKEQLLTIAIENLEKDYTPSDVFKLYRIIEKDTEKTTQLAAEILKTLKPITKESLKAIKKDP